MNIIELTYTRRCSICHAYLHAGNMGVSVKHGHQQRIVHLNCYERLLDLKENKERIVKGASSFSKYGRVKKASERTKQGKNNNV